MIFRIFLGYLGVFSFILYGQKKDYLDSNIYVLTSEFVKESGLSEYDIYFFGESHESLNLSETQFLLIEKLIDKDRRMKLMLETPITYNEILKGLCYDLFLDTSIYKFALFSENARDVEFPSFIRKVYLYNNSKIPDKRIKLAAIDEVDLSAINQHDVLGFYSLKNVDGLIKTDLKIIRRIREGYGDRRKELAYLEFYKQLERHREEHLSFLGKENYKKLSQILKGLEVYSNSLKDTSILYYKSPLREEYMFENFSNEINADSTVCISVNGHFHIPLEVPEEWVGEKKWKSLAYRIKTAYPKKKVCSIYFLNRQVDPLSDQYFPREKQMILENTKPGKTYLVRLDGEDTPFKQLSQKFQYIVVW